jgi:hypothetical protein
MAYIHNKKQFPYGTQMDEPVDFLSEYNGRDNFRKYLASMLQSSIREEILAEDSEQESSDHDSSDASQFVD